MVLLGANAFGLVDAKVIFVFYSEAEKNHSESAKEISESVPKLQITANYRSM